MEKAIALISNKMHRNSPADLDVIGNSEIVETMIEALRSPLADISMLHLPMLKSYTYFR